MQQLRSSFHSVRDLACSLPLPVTIHFTTTVTSKSFLEHTFPDIVNATIDCLIRNMLLQGISTFPKILFYNPLNCIIKLLRLFFCKDLYRWNHNIITSVPHVVTTLNTFQGLKDNYFSKLRCLPYA